jgi:hypothetical protein
MGVSHVISNVKNVEINQFVHNANPAFFLTIKLVMISVLLKNTLTWNKEYAKTAITYANSV